MIGIIFILLWLITDKITKVIYNHDKEAYMHILKWCNWFKYMLFVMAILLTDKYSVNESLFFLLIFVILKIIVDKLNFLDNIIKDKLT